MAWVAIVLGGVRRVRQLGGGFGTGVVGRMVENHASRQGAKELGYQI
jgi:hypothetical protein